MQAVTVQEVLDKIPEYEVRRISSSAYSQSRSALHHVMHLTTRASDGCGIVCTLMALVCDWE